MTPGIPLTPQQRRKRLKNYIFTGVCLSILLAVLLSLLDSGSEQHATQKAPDVAPTAGEELPEREPQDIASDPFASSNTEFPNELQPENGPPQEQQEASGAAASDDACAKLPPWQTALNKLSQEERTTFIASFNHAKAAYDSEQWVACLSLLNDCDFIYAEHPDVRNLRACALLACDKLDEAETLINRSLELNPNDDVALMNQSELLMLRADFRHCISVLERLRTLHPGNNNRTLHDAFTFHQLLCHLMLRQEMEARALVTNITPMTDSPLYYFSQAAFCIYKGDSQGALAPLRSASAIYSENGTASYRKWITRIGLTRKYVRNAQP